MKRRNMKLTIACLVLLSGVALSQNLTDIKLNPKGYTSSKVCGQCHKEIYNYWSKSMHSSSISDPVFMAAYIQAVFEKGEEARKFCLKCHAPTTTITKDYFLKDPISREGIPCDYCHTVKDIRQGKTGFDFVVEVGGAKRAVLKEASSPVHDVAYSELHSKSEFCAGCHELYGENGVVIMGTYSEWKTGPYAAEGVQCVNCHMPEVEGVVVDPSLGTQERRKINRHDISGSHTAAQVRKALALKIESIRFINGKVLVEISVTNSGSGHYVPTGMPSRLLKLTVSMTTSTGLDLGSNERLYGRTLYDTSGETLVEDHAIMTRAAKSGDDNRIKPRERRVEQFWFNAPRGAKVNVKADLDYIYSPKLIQKKEIRIDLHTLEQSQTLP